MPFLGQETAEMLEGINDPESFACALAERAFLVRLVRTVPRPWVFTLIRMERNWFCGLHITFRAGKSLLPL